MVNKEAWLSEREEAYRASGYSVREAIGQAVRDWYDMNPPAEDY